MQPILKAKSAASVGTEDSLVQTQCLIEDRQTEDKQHEERGGQSLLHCL